VNSGFHSFRIQQGNENEKSEGRQLKNGTETNAVPVRFRIRQQCQAGGNWSAPDLLLPGFPVNSAAIGVETDAKRRSPWWINNHSGHPLAASCVD
jgi:hypothetical protein